jgi:hypothetical protein
MSKPALAGEITSQQALDNVAAQWNQYRSLRARGSANQYRSAVCHEAHKRCITGTLVDGNNDLTDPMACLSVYENSE